MTVATKNGHDKNIQAVLELLAETWPATFSIYENCRRPLKIGIHTEILAALDGAITPIELRIALGCYVANPVYRARLIAGAVRVDLSGNAAGVVTPEQIPTPAPAQVPPTPTPAPSPTPPSLPRRLSLADLRAAAARRLEQMTTNQFAVVALDDGLANQAAPHTKTRN